MANNSSGIKTKSITINLPMRVLSRIDDFRTLTGFNQTNAIIYLMNRALDSYETAYFSNLLRRQKLSDC